MTDTDTPTPVLDMDQPSIYRLMGEALAELPAIGKDSYNSQQKFSFRGIDDVLVALNPVLSRKGIFIMPRVLDRTEGTRTTNSGSTMYVVNLRVQFDFYGPRGDHVSAIGQGEGTDMGDKATPKAMTGAFKYVLFEAFAIATKEAAENDSDHGSPPDTVPTVFCSMCKNDSGTIVNFPAPAVDPNPIREHYVTAHGYVRDPDTGKVSPPPESDVPEPTPEPSLPPAATTATAPPTLPQDAPDDPTPPTAPAVDPVPDMDDVTPPGFDEAEWAKIVRDTTALKVSALAEQCGMLGLAKGGTKAEMVARLLGHYGGGSGATDPEPAAEVEAAVEAEVAPTPDDDPDSEKYPFQCPDCNAFPFATEEEYTEHWYKAHGEPEADVAAAADPTPTPDDAPAEPADDVMVEALKSALADLKNQNARAYADYRRKAKLPSKPDDMTGPQVTAALDFIDSLPTI